MVLIRPGTRVDQVPVVEVWRAAARDPRVGPAVDGARAERLRNCLRSPDAFLVVADAEEDDPDAIIGMAAAQPGRADDGTGPPVPGLLHISVLFVVPDRWGEGLGGTLLDTLLDEGRIREYDRAQLWAHAGNSAAHHLCEDRRFLRTGRERQDRDGHPIVHFHRAL
jgi:GNAT superfamily N-acetyltransferase